MSKFVKDDRRLAMAVLLWYMAGSVCFAVGTAMQMWRLYHG